MTGRKSFYVTTPIYYVNDKPHIGHVYTTLACDALARFKRLDGFDVRFLTGTDEHGQKIEKSACSAGLAPETFTNYISQKFLSLTKMMTFSNDDFIRTSETRHILACQALWKTLVQRGQIYLSHYTGWYSIQDETFWNEDELVTMPDGHKATPSGGRVEWIEEASYFFRLAQWRTTLLRLYDARPDFIMPESRRNEVIRFVQMGLEDLSISRTAFTWGIPVPGNSTHVIYVWLDALTNYLTSIGYPENSSMLNYYWTNSLHIVGKDIIRFHAIYWPAFLLAAGLEPPRKIFAHGWWTNNGQKISKSLGNSIDPITLITRYGVDSVRYFLLREVPFGSDGDFSHTAIVNRTNSELANELGNLGLRVLSLINRYCSACVPSPGILTTDDRKLLEKSSKLLKKIRPIIEQLAFHEVLEIIWNVVRSSNSYISYQEPWALYKTDPIRMATVLYVLAETLRHIALLMLPFIPQSANSLLDQLSVAQNARVFSAIDNPLEPNTPLPEPQGIFPRFRERKSTPHEKTLTSR